MKQALTSSMHLWPLNWSLRLLLPTLSSLAEQAEQMLNIVFMKCIPSWAASEITLLSSMSHLKPSGFIDTFTSLLFNFFAPVLDVCKALFISYILCKHNSHCSSIVGYSKALKDVNGRKSPTIGDCF